jgi:hypothetical protein
MRRAQRTPVRLQGYDMGRRRIPVGQQQFVSESQPQPLVAGRQPLPANVERMMQETVDVNQAIAIGAQYGLTADESAAIAVGTVNLTAGALPAEMLAGAPNVTLAPQADPRRAGGYQLRDTVTQENARQHGWSGIGPRPPGFVDPYAVPPSN